MSAVTVEFYMLLGMIVLHGVWMWLLAVGRLRWSYPVKKCETCVLVRTEAPNPKTVPLPVIPTAVPVD